MQTNYSGSLTATTKLKRLNSQSKLLLLPGTYGKETAGLI